MSLRVFPSFAKSLFTEKSTFRFVFAVCLGLGFSMSVILCTIGIMDGFDQTLREGLKTTSGDINIYTLHHHAKKSDFEQAFKRSGVIDFAEILQMEAFAVANDISKGGLVKGIEAQKFSSILKNKFSLNEGEIIIGTELAHALKLQQGDSISLVFAGSSESLGGLPRPHVLKVAGVYDFKVYEHNQRFVLMDQRFLQDVTGMTDLINVVTLNLPQDGWDKAMPYLQRVEMLLATLKRDLGRGYSVRPFWKEYATLLEAV